MEISPERKVNTGLFHLQSLRKQMGKNLNPKDIKKTTKVIKKFNNLTQEFHTQKDVTSLQKMASLRKEYNLHSITKEIPGTDSNDVDSKIDFLDNYDLQNKIKVYGKMIFKTLALAAILTVSLTFIPGASSLLLGSINLTSYGAAAQISSAALLSLTVSGAGFALYRNRQSSECKKLLIALTTLGLTEKKGGQRRLDSLENELDMIKVAPETRSNTSSDSDSPTPSRNSGLAHAIERGIIEN